MTLRRADWDKDVVYLYQFPRSSVSPSLSPYCLKLETWLRMADLNYENIDNQFRQYSAKGQAPFIELNGRQYADSAFIISHLTQTFHVDRMNPKTDEDQMLATAFNHLIEGSAFWLMVKFRAANPKTRMLEPWSEQFTGAKKFLVPIIAWRFSSTVSRTFILKSRLQAMGYGKHTDAELEQIGKADFKAISLLLGTKKYLLGDTPTHLDATAFGHLAQFWFTGSEVPRIKDYIANECGNIVEYIKRIQTEYWPDWEYATTDGLHLDLTKYKEAKAKTAEKTENGS